jgi:glycosyltransferase involved in cell wall biosynthesis
MKVVAVLEQSLHNGGGFQQAMNAVLQMKQLCAGRFAYAVATTDAANMPLLAQAGIESVHLPASLYERLPVAWSSHRVVRRLLRGLPYPLSLQARLLKMGADLAYFVAPWGRVHRFDQLCCWHTVWDLAHVDHPEFPEVSGAFHARERVLRRALGPAALVIADSPQLAQHIHRRYGVAQNRVLAMPFQPAAALTSPNARPRAKVLARHRLAAGYLFYPAQFWAHKNHIRILEALQHCATRGQRLEAVFAGGDMGARAHVEAAAHAMGLQAQVHFLGFVDARDMRGLYEASHALVMPTYFGPTNLPPLEAWSLGVPVIYSSLLAEQVGDAALLADPDDAAALAECILASLDSTLRADLVRRGHQRLAQIDAERQEAEAVLVQHLQRLQARLRCAR